jgi:MFS family permease
MTEKGFFRGIGTNVILLALVSFVNDISSEMIFAVFPFFIASIGGAGIAVGLIGGLGESVSSILKMVSGYWSDKVGRRKPFVFWGYFVSSAAKLLFPFARNWPALAVLVPVERTGKGLRTAPRDAVVAGSTLPEVKGKAFGIHRALDNAGAFIGASTAFVLFFFFKFEFKSILLIAGFLAFLALVPIFFVRETQKAGRLLHFRVSLKKLPADFKHYLIAATLFALGNFTYMFFILRSKSTFEKLFDSRFSIAIPILLYIWFNLIEAVISVPAGMLADKIGKKKAIIIGYILYFAVCVGFSLADSLGLFIVLFALYGAFFGFIEGNQRALASDFVSNDMAGTALGTFHTAISLAVLPGGLIAGLLWNINPNFTFIYGACLSVVSIIFLSRVGRRSLRT